MAEEDISGGAVAGATGEKSEQGKTDGAADKGAGKASGAGAQDKTLLDGGGKEDTGVAAPADWPEDWRAKLAGGDDAALKRMERYKSPVEVARALIAAQTRIASGELTTKLPADATEAQVAEYRKANGIPEKAEGYLEKLPNGLVIGEDDKPIVASFLASMHGKNVAPEVVGEAISWYYKVQEAQIADRKKADAEFRLKSEDALRAEWGADYHSNRNSARAFLDTAPPSEDGTPFRDLLLKARLGDGTAFGDNPAAMKWLARLAAEANPAGFISPGAGGSQADSVDEEIRKIEGLMRTDRAAYNRDTKMQERYRQLLRAQEKLSSRAA